MAADASLSSKKAVRLMRQYRKTFRGPLNLDFGTDVDYAARGDTKISSRLLGVAPHERKHLLAPIRHASDFARRDDRFAPNVKYKIFKVAWKEFLLTDG